MLFNETMLFFLFLLAMSYNRSKLILLIYLFIFIPRDEKLFKSLSAIVDQFRYNSFDFNHEGSKNLTKIKIYLLFIFCGFKVS